MIIALVIISGLAAIAAILSKRSDSETVDQKKQWDEAIANEKSSATRALLNVARPIGRSNLLQRESSSNSYRLLQRKLLASNTFSTSVEVFLAVQMAAFFAGAIIVALTALNTASGLVAVIAGILFACAVLMLPWNAVSKGSKKREDAVLDALPDFAELLQMPLSSGMGILPALDFTAKRMPGTPVAEEVEWLRRHITNYPTQESEAFIMAGERLGTPESKNFFGALLQAHVQGARASETLGRQAAALRKKAFERQRAKAKKLPVTIVLIMGLHFLPFLFILTLLPVFLSIGEVL